MPLKLKSLKEDKIMNPLIDKTFWPSGPWHHEPDLLMWQHAGRLCLIRRTFLGHLCGYVQAAKMDYNEPAVDVHGGLTFGDEWPEWPGIFWLGFNCAQEGDLLPVSICHEGETYRNLAYVIAQTEGLARQLMK